MGTCTRRVTGFSQQICLPQSYIPEKDTSSPDLSSTVSPIHLILFSSGFAVWWSSGQHVCWLTPATRVQVSQGHRRVFINIPWQNNAINIITMHVYILTWKIKLISKIIGNIHIKSVIRKFHPRKFHPAKIPPSEN